MNISQVHYFLTLVETGNFTKAADQLFISQPSLSAAIKKLERELDVVLFERGARKTILTPAGQFFLEKAHVFMENYQSIQFELQRFKQQQILRIGTLRTIRNCNLAQLIGKFREKYPDVTLKLYSGYLEDLENWLTTGVIDLAMTWVKKVGDVSETSLFLFQQELQLAAHPSHLLAKRHSVEIADLHNQPYIERSNCEFRRPCLAIFKSSTIQPQLVYSANDEELVILLIKANLGVSIMPSWKDIKDLVFIPIDDLHLTRNIGLKWRNKIVSDPLKNFRQFASVHNWQV